MSSEQTAKRQPSLLDASCDNFVHDLAELSPTDATAWGIDGYEGELQDFSPEYFTAIADRTREMVADLDALDDTTDESDDEDDFDDVDYVTAAVLRDRLCLDLDLHHHSEDVRCLNNIASPVQTIRDTLLLMPQDTDEDRDAIRSRLSKVKTSLAGYRSSLEEAASHGMVAPHRQISEVIVQCERLADADSMLESLGLDADSAEVQQAKEAFGEFSDWLSNDLQPQAPTKDAVGRERYERFSKLFVGDSVDLDEAYEWGLDQVRYLRNRAFDLVRDLTLSDAANALPALKWLEQVIKTLDSVGSAPRVEHASAHFSPGESCRRKIRELCRQARSSVDICVYTISDDRLSEEIVACHRRGVTVRVISDNEKQHDEGSDIQHLIAQGVPLRIDDSPYHMHHKFALFDGRLLLNGSFNWTRSASTSNEENLLVIDHPQLVSSYAREFDELWARFAR